MNNCSLTHVYIAAKETGKIALNSGLALLERLTQRDKGTHVIESSCTIERFLVGLICTPIRSEFKYNRVSLKLFWFSK